MAYALSLPLTAALAVSAVGLGVHLGRDSVAQINPSFFDRAPPSRFYASLVPAPPSFEVSGIRAPQHPDAIVLDESGSCASCGLSGQAVYMADGSGYDPALAEWREAAPPVTTVTQAASYAASEVDPAMEQVERYANYPVTAEEGDAAAEEELAYAYPE